MKKLAFWVITFTLIMSCKMGSGDAPTYAREWAEKHYSGEYSEVECQSSDSDDDGYVSCTVFFKKPEASDSRSPDPIAIECAHGHGNWSKCNKQTGCRLATGKGVRKGK